MTGKHEGGYRVRIILDEGLMGIRYTGEAGHVHTRGVGGSLLDSSPNEGETVYRTVRKFPYGDGRSGLPKEMGVDASSGGKRS